MREGDHPSSTLPARSPAGAGTRLQRTGARLSVLICDELGRPVRAEGLGRWLGGIAPARARGIVNVALISDRGIRALNRSYRRKDHATDVLSFPATSARRPKTHGPPVVDRLLGDIVIARGVARRQARAAGHSESTELRILALHGLLHLLGYDHERDDGRMLRLERRLRRQGGLREGLIERVAQGRAVRPRVRR